MRKIHYTRLPHVGPIEQDVDGSLLEFIKDLPYFLKKYIPPMSVLNSIFIKGLKDAGMSGGCRWEPFQINEKEYKELKEILLNSGLEEIDTPEWVNTDSDWHIWTFELKTGAPSKEHKRLNDICEEIEKKKKKAIEEGDEEKKIKLHLEYIKAGNDLAEFIMKYT